MFFEIWAQTNGPADTQEFAAALAGVLRDSDLLVLAGDLGAGKTCFTQGLGQALGIEQRITSPTFTLANHYQGRLELNHLDVYRIDQLADSLDLDLPELLETGVTVIEWGEQLLPVLPASHLNIRLLMAGPTDDHRRLELRSEGSAWADRWSTLATAVEQWTVPC